MKPKFDPDIHEDSPPLTAAFVSGMRSSRVVHEDEWVDRTMVRQHASSKLEAPKGG